MEQLVYDLLSCGRMEKGLAHNKKGGALAYGSGPDSRLLFLQYEAMK